MRVALLTQNARAGDAIGRVVLEQVGYFLDRGAQVRVVVADERGLHPALKPYAIRQTSHDVRGAGFQELSRADLVVVQFSQFYPLLELIPLLANNSRRIVIDYQGVTPHAYSPANQRETLLRANEWAGITGFADAVITHSRFATAELIACVALPSDRIHEIGLPVDDGFTPGQPVRSLLARLGIGPSRLLLFVGRLAQNKRLPVLIAALNHLRDVEPPIHAVVVGSSSECYEAERLRCQELAADLGMKDRLHFLGAVDESTLRDCYRSADSLVMPSVHEGFCMPVIEAMACGLPVIAARAGALPETVGHAGLTFSADDSLGLAAQIRRTFAVPKPVANRRIAIVTPGFGEVVGGAERSLTTMADSLHKAGYSVEVFTTFAQANTHTPYPVREFAAEPADNERRVSALARCERGNDEDEATIWHHSLRSESLIAALEESGPFAAVIVGPATTGLARDVVRRFSDRAIVVPCLHDEPAALLPSVRKMFDDAGGVVFHSAAERELACNQFGFYAVNSTIAGASLSLNTSANPEAGRKLVGHDRYVVCVGRRVAEKNLPELFDWARQYHAKNHSFRCAFVGEGALPIPDEPWAIDLGRLSEPEKNSVIAGSQALVQLSVNESLSLVVLEAQALGVPVIVNSSSPVLANHIAAGQGGWAVANYREFTAALDELWNDPNRGLERGQNGRAYVEQNYCDHEAYSQALIRVIENLNQPLHQTMREAGLQLVTQFSRVNWRRDFESLIDQVIDRPISHEPSRVEVTTAESRVESSVWRVVIKHRGGAPLVPSGSGRSEIVVRMREENGDIIGTVQATALREVIAAGDDVAINVMVTRPNANTEIALEPGLRTYRSEGQDVTWFGPMATLRPEQSDVAASRLPIRGPIRSAMALADLPDDYVDVTEGRFARWKHWLKAKVLHNFRIAYVDVLSRQQSRFNRRIVEAIEQLSTVPSDAALRVELAESRRRCDELARRVARLEGEQSVKLVRREAS